MEQRCSLSEGDGFESDLGQSFTLSSSGPISLPRAQTRTKKNPDQGGVCTHGLRILIAFVPATEPQGQNGSTAKVFYVTINYLLLCPEIRSLNTNHPLPFRPLWLSRWNNGVHYPKVMGSNLTLVRVLLCPRLGPFPFLGLRRGRRKTLTRVGFVPTAFGF